MVNSFDDMADFSGKFGSMEVELEKIPSQIGTAMLDASDGRIVKVS